jgi:hypothetical protein
MKSQFPAGLPPDHPPERYGGARMNIEPIHEIPVEEIELILNNAEKFIEWNIEPKHWHFYELIDSIKQSLIHFLPDDEGLIKDINQANEANLIINTFTTEPHPLKEGLIALREIFNVISGEQEYSSQKMQWVINDYLSSIEPYVLKEKLNKYHLTQSEKGSKPRTRYGLTPEERKLRNEKINKAWKLSKLTLNNFAKRESEKYNISPTAIKNIINKPA